METKEKLDWKQVSETPVVNGNNVVLVRISEATNSEGKTVRSIRLVNDKVYITLKPSACHELAKVLEGI